MKKIELTRVIVAILLIAMLGACQKADVKTSASPMTNSVQVVGRNA
jgi:hypothetical protein